MARRAPPSTKDDLLRAAEGCFAEHGLEAAKVEDITARAGIAKGAFYSYFESKEECFRQIVEAFLVRLGAAVERPSSSLERGVPLAQRLQQWLAQDVALLDFCWQNRALLGMLMHASGGAAYAHLLDEFAARAACDAERRLRELVEEGQYRDDVDTKTVAMLLAGAYDRLVREVIRQPRRPDLARLAAETQRLFTRGLLSEQARTRAARTRSPRDDREVARRTQARASGARRTS